MHNVCTEIGFCFILLILNIMYALKGLYISIVLMFILLCFLVRSPYNFFVVEDDPPLFIAPNLKKKNEIFVKM